MKNRQIDYSNGRTAVNMASSAVPILFAQMLSLLYNIVDRIYIGRIPGAGVEALGGVGLCFPIISIITGFGTWFGGGGAPLCSIARGEGNLKKAKQIMNISFWILTAIGFILTLLSFFDSRLLLELFGARSKTLDYGVQYLNIYMLGTIPFLISVGMNPYITAQGYAQTAMISVLIGAVANLILDPVFIFVLSQGIAGAAIATVISQTLSAVFVFWFLFKKAELQIVLPGKFQWNWKTAGNITGLGFAGFIMQATNAIVQAVCNRVLGMMGSDLYISIMTIISSIRQIFDTPVLALSEGTSPLLGFCYGAGKYQEVRKAIRIMTAAGIVYTCVVWILTLLIPGVLASVFSPDPVLIERSEFCIRLYFSAFVFQALQYAGQSVFKSLNKKKSAIFFSLFRKVLIVIPLTLLLPYVIHPAVYGVFLAEPVSNLIGGTCCFLTMYITVYRKLGAKTESEKESIKQVS